MEQTSECCVLLWARCLDEVREISVRLCQIVDLLPCQRCCLGNVSLLAPLAIMTSVAEIMRHRDENIALPALQSFGFRQSLKIGNQLTQSEVFVRRRFRLLRLGQRVKL